MRTTDTLVKLIEFHQDTCIGCVKAESTFHTFDGFRFLIFLVEECQSQVTPYGRKATVQSCGSFPCFHSQVVLALVVIQITQIVRSSCIVRILYHGTLQSKNCFQTVGKTVIGASFDCIGKCLFHSGKSPLVQTPAQIIVSHWCNNTFGNGYIP